MTSRRGVVVATRWIFALLLFAFSVGAHARDRGQFAASSAETKAWFDSLKSLNGPCCSDADGTALSDVDWEARGDHYRVRVDGEWIDVPDSALVKVPNRIGKTMVWPFYLQGRPQIRCFMPGSMT